MGFECRDVRLSCRVLRVSSSGYYEWRKRGPSVRKTEDERLWQKIKKYWERSRKTYSRARITMDLKNDGEIAGKNRVAKIMKLI